MKLGATLFGERYEFADTTEVLAKANDERSGDQLAGVAAASAAERAAAKYVLSEMTLEALRHNPVVPYDDDDVTRVIDDAVNETIYDEFRSTTVGEFREWILDNNTTDEMIRRCSNGLTAEMIAGVTKLQQPLDRGSTSASLRLRSFLQQRFNCANDRRRNEADVE